MRILEIKKLLCALFCLPASVYCIETSKIPKKPISLETPIIGDSEDAHVGNFIENKNEFSSTDIENIKKLSLDELKMLSAVALVKKCPEQKNWNMPIRKLAQFAYPFEQHNQKTGMSESYLTFIQESRRKRGYPTLEGNKPKKD